MMEILDQELGRRGNRQARAVIELADTGTETPIEVLTFLNIEQIGLPRPTLQRRYDIDGSRYFVDAHWGGILPDGRPWNVVVESDGFVKYPDRSALVKERERDNALRSTGAIVIHVSWEIVMDIDKFAHTVIRAFPTHVRRMLRPNILIRNMRAA